MSHKPLTQSWYLYYLHTNWGLIKTRHTQGLLHLDAEMKHRCETHSQKSKLTEKKNDNGPAEQCNYIHYID